MISHHHKCIFIHIPKNAGQSMEHVFLNLLGLKWETRAPLLLMYNNRPELGPPRLAHLKADEYVRFKYLTQEMFDKYYKFAFVRNPFDWLVSLYFYIKQSTGHHLNSAVSDMEFPKFIEWYIDKNPEKQIDFLINPDKKTLIVNYIGRFEKLSSRCASVSARSISWAAWFCAAATTPSASVQ